VSQPLTGFDAFYLAANNGRHDLVALMLDHGCDATQVSRIGTTVYNGIILKRNMELFNLFIERNVPVSPASTGRWPLHCAVKRRDGELIELLLENTDSDVNCVDRRGDTPTHLAAKLGLSGICELLADFGAAIEQRNKAGYTLLHVTAEYGHLRVVEGLYAAAADLTVIDAQCRTARNLAVIRKKKACVKWFEAQGLTNDNMVEKPAPRRKRRPPGRGANPPLDKRTTRALLRTLR
jgi:ankyrin repeat protein